MAELVEALPPWPTVSPFRRWVGRSWMRLFGWKVEGEPPPFAKAVFVAAPHTSNWDLFFMLATAWSLGLAPSWFGKHTVFWGPFGPIMRFLGGIPVDRRRRHDYVSMAVGVFDRSDKFYLVVSPPGTRKRTGAWKSGFYHIAQGAKAPLCCAFLDFERKVGGIGPTVIPTGDVGADMDRLRDFYSTIRPRHPQRMSDIRLGLESKPDREG